MGNPNAVLPLNCVDKGLLALNCIKESPQFHWILKIRGSIDPGLLEKALRVVLQAHPNLRTKVSTRYLRPIRVTHDVTECKFLTCLDFCKPGSDQEHEEAVKEWLNKPIDAFTEFPIRVLLVKKSSTESHLIFKMDHSALDGVRSVRFIHEVVDIYNGSPQRIPTSLSDFRHTRGDELLEFARARRDTIKGFYFKILLSLIYRFLIAPLNPQARLFFGRTKDSDKLGYFFEEISQIETEQMRKRARTASSTINDILLAAFFEAAARWRTLHGKVTKKVSIMVPVDIGSETFKGVISNQVSFISLRTLPSDRVDRSQLLLKIRQEMAATINNGTPFSIIYFLHFVSYVPFPMFKALAKLIMSTRVYVDTILLSNLGVLWPDAWGAPTMGSSLIENINPIMPVMTPMGLSIEAHTYNERLHICMAYRTTLLSQEEARKFLALYMDELRNYL